jgi:hypothetical protein
MKKPLIGAKEFRSFHWTKGTSSRGHGGSPRKRALCVWEKGKGKEKGRRE